MLQLKNTSPFKAQVLALPDAQGIDTLYVVVKATFTLHPKLALADEQLPVTLADAYWGEPGKSSLKYASEAHLTKPGTDVVVVGEAFAPHGRAAPSVDVGLTVAGRTGGFRVFGDRRWERSFLSTSPSRPEPFVRMPLVYERAFGGVHVEDELLGEIHAEGRNPVGRGFLGKREADELSEVGLPNLEDVQALIRSPGDAQRPMGFGFVAPNWEPRLGYAGTYDERWQKERAPYLPDDFDPRFFHGAHPDWVFEKPLKGGEEVVMFNLSPRMQEKLRIPTCALDITVKIAGQPQTPRPSLETVLLEPSEGRLCLTFRAAVPCDKKLLKVEEIAIGLQQCSFG